MAERIAGSFWVSQRELRTRIKAPFALVLLPFSRLIFVSKKTPYSLPHPGDPAEDEIEMASADESTRSTTANAQDHGQCGLLGLPAELRLHIWELAFPTMPRSIKTAKELIGARGPDANTLLICHQIKAEAADIFEECPERWKRMRYLVTEKWGQH
ncbi:hypothetical protein LTR37_016613 [Vermiconidia calcicola]|uniref:Uncharacterized protein n=1 Tax=Vermiconidia calcicola TaxID=1690605 RepID=A0ACC3MMH8_9PEZI|nr:hypothetical protein LTR37_016613 [Vermiconidia calcicola]